MEEDKSRRRHSVNVTADAPNRGRRVSFFGIEDNIQMQSQSRRHSVMILPQGGRRTSIDQRPRRQSRRFSIQPLDELSPTTFTGLPVQSKHAKKAENTFKLEPDPETKFKPHVVKAEIEQIMDFIVADTPFMNTDAKNTKGNKLYHRSAARAESEMAKRLVAHVKERLKSLEMNRYKLVVNAFVGDCCGQGLLVASRSLWNTDTDGHVTVVRQTATKYAVVVAHCVYYE